MQYMLLIYDDPTTETPDAYERHSVVAEQMRQAGVHVAADPLQPVGDEDRAPRRRRGHRHRRTLRGDARTSRGFYLIDCAVEDEAIEYARKLPLSGTSCIEVRRVGYE